MDSKFKSLYEINGEAISVLTNSVLTKELGVANTIKFINQYHTGLADYTKERAEVFKNLTLDDIVADLEKGKSSKK